MESYWTPKLTLEEAWNYSENGIAIFGNPAMRDVIWEKGSPHPKWWINKGYRDTKPERFVNRIGWYPDKPTKEYDEMADRERELFETNRPKMNTWYTQGKNGGWIEVIPKPINHSKWILDETRNVYRYEKNGNWAEVSAALDTTEGFWPTKLCIKGEIKEFIDHGWYDREGSMDYCEWQVDHPDGMKMGWWGSTWRLLVFALLVFTCFSWPLYSFIGYCIFTYTVMGYLLLSGELSSVGSVRKQIISGFFLWLLSPIVFIFLLIFSCFAIL